MGIRIDTHDIILRFSPTSIGWTVKINGTLLRGEQIGRGRKNVRLFKTPTEAKDFLATYDLKESEEPFGP